MCDEKRITCFFGRLMRAVMNGDEDGIKLALACPDFSGDMLYSALVMAIGLDRPTHSRAKAVELLWPAFVNIVGKEESRKKLGVLSPHQFPIRSNAMFKLLRSME